VICVVYEAKYRNWIWTEYYGRIFHNCAISYTQLDTRETRHKLKLLISTFCVILDRTFIFSVLYVSWDTYKQCCLSPPQGKQFFYDSSRLILRKLYLQFTNLRYLFECRRCENTNPVRCENTIDKRKLSFTLWCQLIVFVLYSIGKILLVFIVEIWEVIYYRHLHTCAIENSCIVRSSILKLVLAGLRKLLHFGYRILNAIKFEIILESFWYDLCILYLLQRNVNRNLPQLLRK
jgi:hypothetical protein